MGKMHHCNFPLLLDAAIKQLCSTAWVADIKHIIRTQQIISPAIKCLTIGKMSAANAQLQY